ncbi:MAG: DMT family transporter [Myxococcales bacterium]
MRRPLVVGGSLAVLAAVAFGLTVPFTQRAGQGVGPFATAAWLYGGACVFAGAMLLARRRGTAVAAVRTVGLGRIVVVALLGAAVAPTMLAWGLQRVAGTTAALLLNLEAVFTVLLARVLWRETFSRRAAMALVFMVAAGGLLALDAGRVGGWTAWGVVAVAAATLAWALDNVVARPLAEHEPLAVVFGKSVIGAAATAALAVISRDAAGLGWRALALAACGAAGYGLSLALYLQAQRRIGAARTASIFAVAPFVGAIVAWGLGERDVTPATLVAAALFAGAVALHLTERHRHRHRHEVLLHEHPHRHDDQHHLHAHQPPVLGEHTHPHHHEPLHHEHEHGPDLHHSHDHRH